jgi:hypothetical protein
MLARNSALNAMGYNVVGQCEVYNTQAARLLHDYGYEASPAPIKIIDASADPPALIEYPARPGAENEAAEDEDAIMTFETAHKQAALNSQAGMNAQAGLIATRMRRAKTILGKAIGRSIVPSLEVTQWRFDYEIKSYAARPSDPVKNRDSNEYLFIDCGFCYRIVSHWFSFNDTPSHLMTLSDMWQVTVTVTVQGFNVMIFDIVVSPPRLRTSKTEEGNVIHGTVVAKQSCREFDEILVLSQGNEHPLLAAVVGPPSLRTSRTE